MAGVLPQSCFSPLLISFCRLSYFYSHLLLSLPCLILPAGSPWQGELDKLSAPSFIRKSVLNDVRHNLFPQRIFILSQEFAASAATDSQIQKTEIWTFFLGVYIIYRYPPNRKKNIIQSTFSSCLNAHWLNACDGEKSYTKISELQSKISSVSWAARRR